MEKPNRYTEIVYGLKWRLNSNANGTNKTPYD